MTWVDQYPQQQSIETLYKYAYKTKSIKELEQKYLNNGPYYGIPQNLVAATEEGDIGYFLLAGKPNRKSKIPYHSCFVLDGTTTEFDWDGVRDLKENPYIINPEKGYIVTANNRQYPDFVVDDFGTESTSTARA